MKIDLHVVGVISQDINLHVPIHPKPDSETYLDKLDIHHGGAGANVAAYSSFYGQLSTKFIGAVGKDAIGGVLLDRLREYGVDTSSVLVSHLYKSTRIYTLQLPDDHRSYVIFLGAHTALEPSSLLNKDTSITSPVFVAPCSPLIHDLFFNKLIREGSPIFFNPGSVYFDEGDKSSLQKYISYSQIVFINSVEAQKYSGKVSTVDAGLEMLGWGPDVIVITSGSSGCTVFVQETNSFTEIGTLATRVVNPVGAGDAFAAGFITEYLRSGDYVLSAKIGSLFGAFSVSQDEPRKANPSFQEFLEFKSQYHNN